MAGDHLHFFNAENGPLGPVAVSDTDAVERLRVLYDDTVRVHEESREHPPTFIVGRRGSGKTALLLSRQFDSDSLNVRLSTSETLNHVHQSILELQGRMLVSVETASKLWAQLLWGPIAVRVAQMPNDRRDPRGHAQRLWQSTKELRAAAAGSVSPDDAVLEALTTLFLDEFHSAGRIVSLDQVASSLEMGGASWSTTQALTRDLIRSRKLEPFVLIDSLENLGDLVDQIQTTLQGLFHLVGRSASKPEQFRIQCCFPSELWPKLTEISSNPTKDFSARLTLQWRKRDLVHVCSTRLAHYLRNYPGEYPEELLESPLLLENFLPLTVVNNSGIEEETIAYVLRHTQLLPRQVLHILNRVLQLAINDRPGRPPLVESRHVVDGVMDVEGLLCGEVFSAHHYRYEAAERVAASLLPTLPFRFTDSEGHRAWNRCGLKHELQEDWVAVRTMLTDIGILGRLVDETDRYINAEFAYTVPGRLTLSHNEEYCLHPLFVREFRSVGINPGTPRREQSPSKPVHPVQTRVDGHDP
jgi:hypothetical protein